MAQESLKDFLIKKFPPSITSPEQAYGEYFWENCDFEKVQELSNKVIELFKNENMTYTDAYAMLGFIHKDLEYRSTTLRL